MGGSFRTQVLNSYLRIVTQWCLENILSFIEKYIHFAAAFYCLLESRVLSKKIEEKFSVLATLDVVFFDNFEHFYLEDSVAVV